MNVIISFCGLQERQKALHTRRPFALQPLAASTILGHIIERLKGILLDNCVIIVNSDADVIQEWTKKALLEHHFTVIAAKGKTPLAGLQDSLKIIDEDPLLFISGEFISEANYESLDEQEADLVCLVQEGMELIPAETVPLNDQGYFSGEWGRNEVMWAGGIWFRRSSNLKDAIIESNFTANPYLNTLLAAVKKQGLTTASQSTQNTFGTGTPERLLHANARLMQLGYCSDDAIERSYGEEFTVLPPVFLHETAVIENSVVGPFVNLEAGAELKNCIVRNSLVGENAVIEDAVIENSFIGDQGHFLGPRQTVIVGDDTRLISD